MYRLRGSSSSLKKSQRVQQYLHLDRAAGAADKPVKEATRSA
jgi:hypothetical protein